jgi:peptidoglycan/LPS O-acetylase OafA/YrhL
MSASVVYRREIDGLRAIAVMPVVLGHAKIAGFSGGFVGVDVFFVISGYLISTIIINDLDTSTFSFWKFYERRARRILPALFFVMALITPFAAMWMMPEDFKNYGQSLVATTLFSNNILLAITSGYWDSSTNFKPLLHTWSLGVEEQFYVIFPILLVVIWKSFRNFTLPIIAFFMLASFGLAAWSVIHDPALSFYLLPTRGWELLAGTLTAYWIKYRQESNANFQAKQVFSLFGLGMILFSIFVFDESYLSPGPFLLFPVVGSVLVIYCAVDGTLVQRVLSSSVPVGVGLISYSLYLWHQPLFALARVYAKNSVSTSVYAVLIGITFICAYLTWKFVEAPFRDSSRISFRRTLICLICAATFIAGFGLYLDRTYGMSWRIFDQDAPVAVLDKRIYNERAFKFKVTQFEGDGRLKVLVIGNSFGRDVINMIWEGYGENSFDMVYSDVASNCIYKNSGYIKRNLLNQSDVIIFASGYNDEDGDNCVKRNIVWSDLNESKIFYIGTKHFGENLNWIVRLPKNHRPNQYNKLPRETLDIHRNEINEIPSEHFISLLSPVLKNNLVPITDENGQPISVDRAHVTKFGAKFFFERAIKPSALGLIFAKYSK